MSFVEYAKYANKLLLKRWLVIACTVLAIEVLVSSMLAPSVMAYQKSVNDTVQTTVNNEPPPTTSGSNAVSNAASTMSSDVGQGITNIRLRTASAIASGAVDIVKVNKGIERGTVFVAAGSYHVAKASFLFSAHIIGSIFMFSAHVVGAVFSFTGHVAAGIFTFTGHIVGGGFGYLGHVGASALRLTASITHVHASSLIKPTDNTPIPVITQQLRAQQVAIVEKGTTQVAIAEAAAFDSGGACDNGEGNGGYPMNWCNSPMDSVATVPYTSDPINRECTSYAYWYFTDIEGHTDFHALYNAKNWAYTSNYPTHSNPVPGAIAVETAGAYGHVAIVQAMPGQTYAGQVVPAGYVLVSEMNFDWAGHFRYSYSPIGKFTTFIYP